MIATAIGGFILTLSVIAITTSYGIRADMSPIVISNESTESVAITMADNIEVTQPEDRYLGISLSAGIEIIVADTTGSPRVEYPSGLAPYITVSERNGKLNLLISRHDGDSSTGRGYYRHIECSYPIRIITPSSSGKDQKYAQRGACSPERRIDRQHPYADQRNDAFLRLPPRPCDS